MGAKASTAAGNQSQSPRTFSNSSSSDVVSAGNNNATSFNFLRAINGVDSVSGDSRQRARSMSAMPEIHQASSTSSSSSSHNNNNNNLNHNNHHYQHHHHHHYPPNAFSHVQQLNSSQPYEVANGCFPHAGAGAHFGDLSNSPEESNSHDESNQMHPLGIGRVVATSLPSHIWSLNGE